MFVVKKTDFSRDFNTNNLLAQKQKEVKTWQWLILIGCFLFQMFPYCVSLNLTNVFVPTDWTIWLNGDQTLMSLTFTVGAVGAALVGPLIARLFSSKINMRLFYGIGVFLAVLGFFGSAINTFVPFANRSKGVAAAILYISNFISQAGVMIFSGLGVNNLISKWWPAEKRGFALGIAFTGGSLGNIWMQQLVNVLAKEFGNSQGISQTGLPADLGGGERWATYVILSGMGLITGLLIVTFVCRKPVPPTELFASNINTKTVDIKCVGCDQLIKSNNNLSKPLEVSPLVTKKYPVYWILCVGYLILQMGTIHASMNGVFIRNATNGVLGTNDGTFNNVMAIGGTIFGIFCLIGNFSGGILNDKIGPNKSIGLAGFVQVLAILSLMFSVKIQALVYVYFIFAGLSVYVYTSTPSYLCGRLYGPGQSNNHMSILGIFVALGFAITNSIVGTITGNTAMGQNPQTMFGEPTNGNMFGLGIFALVCMALGTIIVTISTTMIMNKGIKGLLNYSPTKYTRIITFKYALVNKFAAIRILLTKKDYRVDNKKRIAKIDHKLQKSKTYNTNIKFLNALNESLKNSKKINLTTNEKLVLSFIFENKLVWSGNLQKLCNVNNPNNIIKKLLSNKLIDEHTLQNIGNYYSLNEKFASKLIQPNIDNEITKDNIWLIEKIQKITHQTNKKIQKINDKLNSAKAIVIDQAKQNKINNISNKLLTKDKIKKEKIFAKAKKLDDWQAYKIEYAILQKIYDDQELKNKLQNKKENKIAKLNKKIFIANYVMNFNKYQEINGHNLLVDYYNDEYLHCNKLINDLVENSIENKINKIHKSTQILQKKYNKQLSLKQKLFLDNSH